QGRVKCTHDRLIVSSRRSTVDPTMNTTLDVCPQIICRNERWVVGSNSSFLGGLNGTPPCYGRILPGTRNPIPGPACRGRICRVLKRGHIEGSGPKGLDVIPSVELGDEIMVELKKL